MSYNDTSLKKHIINHWAMLYHSKKFIEHFLFALKMGLNILRIKKIIIKNILLNISQGYITRYVEADFIYFTQNIQDYAKKSGCKWIFITLLKNYFIVQQY